MEPIRRNLKNSGIFLTTKENLIWHKIYAWDQRFVTKPCKSIGICTVFCFKEGGGGLKILKIVLRIMWTFPWLSQLLHLLRNENNQNYEILFSIRPCRMQAEI
jgi:hypothetical protein